MKTAKLIIDGKEIEVNISQEQYEKLFLQKKKTGYERSKFSQYYYRAEVDGRASIPITDGYCYYDNKSYDNANYYSDQTIADNNARADKLMRQLRRFAVEHREKKLDWGIETQWKYRIVYDYYKEAICRDWTQTRKDCGAIYFDSKETAQLAIDTFKDELIWYFTEYQDSL